MNNLVSKGLPIDGELLLLLLLSKFSVVEQDDYNNMKPNDRKELETQLDEICVGYLETPNYKSGAKKKEMIHKIWFYIIITAAGFLLINILSVIFLSCYFMRKKKNIRQSGGLDKEIEM
ncbi:hypothetical protein CAEBREN_11687 [Caenorhabditis brenneri]|uniref:Uncharacterized protein n=1 Tax=Caenorhabditis brenneri TaxID=135651 RepID=G0MDI4_CAEBE|nr:hypothetical protein CAEBREN_11687 [Caenorhabditis brenneri]